MNKIYHREHLDQALADAGIISKTGAYPWILRQEKSRRLICPRDIISRQRRFTKEQIEGIVKAFLPDGCGWWTPDGRPIPKAIPRPDETLTPIPMAQSPRIQEIKQKETNATTFT